MDLIHILVVIFLVSLSLNMCGCTPLLVVGGVVAGGAGTATWISGKLVQEVDASFEKTIQASELALASLNLNIVKYTKKTDVAQIKSNYIDGETIWIDIHRFSHSTSRVEVRVGAIPDKEAAAKILDKIKEYLKRDI